MMLVGFAITQHCNLRCPHCIRDDVETVRALPAAFILDVLLQARSKFGAVHASFTGGEPLLHPEFDALLHGLRERDIPYRFTSNGWHLKRVLPLLERCPPSSIRLSLSGATEATHDHERGRGSFRRVLLATALATSRRIPVHFSIVVDRRNRHEVATAAALAESLGIISMSYILPQPVPATLARGSDLDPQEWWAVRDEVNALPAGRTRTWLEYGAPFDGEEQLCQAFSLERIYVDAQGRLSICCQLSDYGHTEGDVVADLRTTSLDAAWPLYLQRVREQFERSRPAASGGDVFDRLPCIRCARSCGKLDWIGAFRDSAWGQAGRSPALVQLSR